MALLLLVLGIATFGRRWVAMLVALAAALALNFFFIPPIGEFTVAEPQHGIALVAFVIVAIVGSSLSASAQARAREKQKADLAATLLASLNHDLRTPLTAVRLVLENLGQDLPPDERRRQAGVAVAEVERLTRLFDQLLDMARVDAGAIRLDPQWVSPADVVDAALVHARHAIDGRMVIVDAQSELAVHVDPRWASVALGQLLENAAKYAPHPGGIRVVARGTPEGLRVSVEDEGPGIDPRDADRLFDRFYRGRTAEPAPAGTGMGLAISRGLVEAAEGRVWAENVPEGGARFCMIVPGPVRDTAQVE